MLQNRLHHVLVGAFAGLAGWLLTEILPDLAEPRLLFFLIVAATVFFLAALVMLAELGPRATLPAAALVALVSASFAHWGALRFDTIEAFAGSVHVLGALLLLASLPVPFVMSRLQGGGWGWLDYTALFQHSWNIVVRVASAAVFSAVVWVVAMLSAMLLDLVGVTQLGKALQESLLAWLLLGGATGLGMAVVSEMPDLVSPYLLLRLLRLLVPMVLLVVAVFVAALPLRGLTGLFGELSAAGMLLATSAGVVALISVSVDQSDEEAVDGWLLPSAARGLAVLLPVLAVLAAWAVALRVGDYGWTPARLAAAAGAGVSLGYGALYLLAVLRGRRWMDRIRRANLTMAVVLIGLSALWLSPLLNAEAISARSQMQRFAEGSASLAELPLWELQHDWGRPGQAVIADLRLRAGLPGQEPLAARLAELAAARASWEFYDQPPAPEGSDATLTRGAEVPVLPASGAMPDQLWLSLGRDTRQDVLTGCDRRTPAGHPACLLLLAELAETHVGDEAVLIFDTGKTTVFDATLALALVGGNWTRQGNLMQLQPASFDPAAAIDALRADGVRLLPSGLSALGIGAQRLIMRP